MGKSSESLNDFNHILMHGRPLFQVLLYLCQFEASSLSNLHAPYAHQLLATVPDWYATPTDRLANPSTYYIFFPHKKFLSDEKDTLAAGGTAWWVLRSTLIFSMCFSIYFRASNAIFARSSKFGHLEGSCIGLILGVTHLKPDPM